MNQSGQSPQPLIDVSRLTEALQRFSTDRDWDQFHSPKNLVMALTAEVGELVELFQWVGEAESRDLARDEKTSAAVREELADVLMYLVRLSNVLGVDLAQAAADKLCINEQKYPVHKARGSSKKYTDL